MNRLTVSQIVNLLLWKERDIQYGSNTPYWILQEGKRIHNRLGYDQAWMFRRYFFQKEIAWLIVGMPDKIEKGVIKELKTYRTRVMPDTTLQGAKIQTQIYCWLTGLKNWQIIGYSTFTNKASIKARGEYDETLTEKYISGAIILKEKLAEIAKEYQKLRKEFWEE